MPTLCVYAYDIFLCLIFRIVHLNSFHSFIALTSTCACALACQIWGETARQSGIPYHLLLLDVRHGFDLICQLWGETARQSCTRGEDQCFCISFACQRVSFPLHSRHQIALCPWKIQSTFAFVVPKLYNCGTAPLTGLSHLELSCIVWAHAPSPMLSLHVPLSLLYSLDHFVRQRLAFDHRVCCCCSSLSLLHVRLHIGFQLHGPAESCLPQMSPPRVHGRPVSQPKCPRHANLLQSN